MEWAGLRCSLLIGGVIMATVACSGLTQKPPPTLQAPVGSNPSAARAVQEGNRLFAMEQWGAAQNHYAQAIQTQPDLAEAHYNLALTLEKLGNTQQAHDHYIQAANLAPGHKVIWDSPVLRKYGNVTVSQDPTAPSVLPPVGGLGGGIGGYGGR